MFIVQPGITLLLINLSGNTKTEVSVTAHAAAAAAAGAHKHVARTGYTTAQVSVTNQAAAAAAGGEHKHGARRHARKFGHAHAHAPGFAAAADGATRDEYHLTPKGGDLRSQVVLLNGKALATGADGSIPRLEAVKVDAAQPIALAPYSIVFARISHFHAPACS